MTVKPGLPLPLKAVGKRVEGWDESGNCLQVEVSGAVRRAACPSCLHRSSQVPGCYQRQLADLPSFGQRVTLSIDVRRFKCVNPNCARRTFSEKLDSLAEPSQRRTQRLSESVRSLGYALGGAAAVRFASRLGVSTSGDTVLRELRRAGCAEPATSPVVVGIDDWMAKFLGDSGFGKALHVTVISDAVANLASLADKMPQNGTRILAGRISAASCGRSTD